jgi:predicted  nucleic acid-binding Zn-ribbon protein
MLNEFIEKNDSLAKDKELLETECTTLKTELDSVIAAQGAHEEEWTKLKNDAAVLSATMKTKSEELDGCQEKLTAANAKITSLQGQLKKYQVEVESLKSNLESEVLQNQDRKKKIRVYVDKLTADKASLHDQLESKKAAFNALTEDRNNICTQMLQTTDRLKLVQEEFQLERDELNCQLDESRDKISQIMIESAQEIETLQQRISVFEKQNSETLQQVEERVLQSNQEVSEHKSKRLAARSEMIGLAQVCDVLIVSIHG